jgi:hypothetical protein
MVIPPSYRVSAFSIYQNLVSGRQSAAAESAPASPINSVADQVTISPKGQELSRNASSSPQTTYREQLSAKAHADPAMAKDLLNGYTFGFDLLRVNVPLPPGDHPSGSTFSMPATSPLTDAMGRLVTDERRSSFEQTATRVRDGRMAIYRSEQAKGTSAAEILDKIFSFMDSQPTDYQLLSGWLRSSSAV